MAAPCVDANVTRGRSGKINFCFLIKGNNLAIRLLVHEKWAVDAMLEAWQRVVSTSQARAGARVKVDRP